MVAPDSGSGPACSCCTPGGASRRSSTSVCDRLADAGFVALAPDLHGDGRTADTPDEAEALLASTDPNRTASLVVVVAVGAARHAGHARRAASASSASRWARRGRSGPPPASPTTSPPSPPTTAARTSTSPRPGPRSRATSPRSTSSSPTTTSTYLEAQLRLCGHPVEFHHYPGTGHWFAESDRPAAHVPVGRRAGLGAHHRVPPPPARRPARLTRAACRGRAGTVPGHDVRTTQHPRRRRHPGRRGPRHPGPGLLVGQRRATRRATPRSSIADDASRSSRPPPRTAATRPPRRPPPPRPPPPGCPTRRRRRRSSTTPGSPTTRSPPPRWPTRPAIDAMWQTARGDYSLYNQCSTGEFDTSGCLFRGNQRHHPDRPREAGRQLGGRRRLLQRPHLRRLTRPARPGVRTRRGRRGGWRRRRGARLGVCAVEDAADDGGADDGAVGLGADLDGLLGRAARRSP